MLYAISSWSKDETMTMEKYLSTEGYFLPTKKLKEAPKKFIYKNIAALTSAHIDGLYKASEVKDYDALLFHGRKLLMGYLLYEKDEEIIRKVGDFYVKEMDGSKDQSIAYLTYGNSLEAINDVSGAIYYFNKAYERAIEMGDFRSRFLANHNMILIQTFVDEDGKERYSKEAIKRLEDERKVVFEQLEKGFSYKRELFAFWTWFRFYIIHSFGKPEYFEILAKAKALEKTPFLEGDLLLLENKNRIYNGEYKEAVSSLLKLIEDVDEMDEMDFNKKQLKQFAYAELFNHCFDYIEKKDLNRVIYNGLLLSDELGFLRKRELYELLIDKLKDVDEKQTLKLEKELLALLKREFDGRQQTEFSISKEQIRELKNAYKKIDHLGVVNSKLTTKVSYLSVSTVLFLILVMVLGYLAWYRMKIQYKLKKLNDNLNKKNKEIQEKNQTLQNFSYTIAHDFREPIRSLSFSINSLYNFDIDEEERKRQVEFSNGSLFYLNKLISDFLEYSNSSVVKPNVKSLPLKDSIELAIYNLRRSIGSALIEVPENLPHYKFNFEDFVSVFQNLIGNAIKYRSNERLPKVHITFKEIGKYYVIYVKDNGVGIPENMSKKIFEPFQRIYPKGTQKGSGLGLCIVKNNLEKYNATISVKNNSDVGCTFIIRLPIVDNHKGKQSDTKQILSKFGM